MNLTRILAVALVTTFAVGDAVAQKKKKKKKKGRKAKVQKMTAGGPTLRYEQFRRKIEFKVAEKREDQIKGINRLLELGPPEEEVPDLKFRLAELYFEKARFFFFRAQEAEEKAMNSRKDRDKSQLMAEKKRNTNESKTWAARAVQLYSDIRQGFPKYKRMPEVLFALGQSYWSAGRLKSAIEIYADLIRNFRESPLVAEAWIAFGEYYFAEGDVNKALRSYKKAAADKRSQVYGFALYKQGWCYYNLSDWKEALRKFKATVLYSQLSDELQGQNKIALGREAQKDYVRTYAHIGDDRKAPYKFADLLGENDCKAKSCLKMLEQLAGIWYDDGYFPESASIYRQLISLDGNNTRVPFFQGKIVDLVSRSGNKKRTITESRRLIDLYKKTKAQVAGRTSKSEEDEQAREDVREAAELAERTIRNLAQVWNREAKKTRQNETYKYAMTMYVMYTDLFPNSKFAYEMRFQLGDIYYKLEKFDDAAKAYEATVKAKPKAGKYLIEAATDNIFAVEEHIKDLRIKSPKASSKPQALHPQKQRLIDACDRYAQSVPADAKGAKHVNVRFKAGKVYYDYSHYDEAIKRFDTIVEQHPADEEAEFAANLVIDVYNIREDWQSLYATATRYQRIDKLLDGREKLAKDLARFSEYGKFSLVQILEKNVKKERGDMGQVARAYEDFYNEFPKSDNADKALFNASVAYDKLGEKDKADQLRARLLKEFKKSPLRADVAYYVAKRYEERTEYKQAAKRFLSFAKTHPRDERARDAMYNAAIFYAGVGEVRRANKLREEYLKKYGRAKGGEKEAADIYYSIALDLDRANRYRQAASRYKQFAKEFSKDERVWDALWREAQIRRTKLRQRSAADKLEKKILGTYKYLKRKRRKIPNNAKRYASQVAFGLLEADFKKYKRLRIRTPSTRNPKPFRNSVKDKALARTKLVKMYTRIVTEYQQAESSIAALHRIALSWDEFAGKLTAVPCPRGVNEEACMLIKQGIDEIVAPARESAYAAYQTCVKKSNELNAFTKESTACVKALEKLAPDAFPEIVERRMDYQKSRSLDSLPTNSLILRTGGADDEDKEAQAANTAKGKR